MAMEGEWWCHALVQVTWPHGSWIYVFFLQGQCFAVAYICLAPSPHIIVLISKFLLNYAVLTNLVAYNHKAFFCVFLFGLFFKSHYMNSRGWLWLCVVFMPERSHYLRRGCSHGRERVMADHAMALEVSLGHRTTSVHILAKASCAAYGMWNVHFPLWGHLPCRMSLMETSCKYFEQLWSIFL